jgi:hypothetical protein
MSTSINLTGRWIGQYFQRDRPYAIAADLVQAGDRLTGTMRDAVTDREHSVFEAAAEAGLPPGADEHIVAGLRRMMPDAPAAPIRCVSHLPPESTLEGQITGRRVYFLKSYQGTHFSGYRVGDKLVVHENSSHAVHYGGQLTPDGMEIEGTWWIDPPRGLARGTQRTEGRFCLRRQDDPPAPEPTARTAEQDAPRWWPFSGRRRRE